MSRNHPNVHGRRTAYAFYVQACRKEFEDGHPNETPNFVEFIENCQKKWTTMTDSEKIQFQELADADKIRYDTEMYQHGYDISESEGQKRKRKQLEPIHPKQPLSAFYWYCNDMRSIVKDEHPEFDQGQVAVEMGRRWIAADPIVKEKYEAISENERIRYDKEMMMHTKKINLDINV